LLNGRADIIDVVGPVERNLVEGGSGNAHNGRE
jgi:hypothetical protein